CRVLESQPLEGPDSRHVSQELGQDSRADARLRVVLPPRFLVSGARKTVQKLSLREVGCLAHQGFLMGLERDLGHSRNQPADREAIRSDRKVLMGKRVL